MRAILGEILLATYVQDHQDGMWTIAAPAALVAGEILARNRYSNQEDAERAIKMLVPLQCRLYIRFIP